MLVWASGHDALAALAARLEPVIWTGLELPADTYSSTLIR